MSEPVAPSETRKRHKCFEETHQEMIETAVRLISQRGTDALSIAAIARAMKINRTTVYYHFESRDALLDAVKIWSSEQLAKGMSHASPQRQRMDFITRFVLENPELIKLWIDDFISEGDIRTRYPVWDELVKGIAANFAGREPPEQVDAEVYCVIMLAGAIVGARVFKNSVSPSSDIDTIVQRFRAEHERILSHESLID